MNYAVYTAALRDGILERNGMALCESQNSPRLHNIVDLAITGTIVNFGWPNVNSPWARSYCFDIFDILLEDFDCPSEEWYIQIINKSGSSFDKILRKTPLLLEVTGHYVREFDIFENHSSVFKSHYDLFQTCITLFGVCGLRTHFHFVHLSQKEGVLAPDKGIDSAFD